MQRKCLVFFSAFCILSISSNALCASRLDKEMVAFDKVFITALIVTDQSSRAASKNIMKLLVPNWQSFKKDNGHFFASDKSARVDFAQISQMIDDAARTVRLNGNLSEASEILECARIIFRNLRNRNSLDYYLDYLTRFHESMENMLVIARDKTAATLSDGNLLTIKSIYAENIRDWEELRKANFDRMLFSFSEEKEARRIKYLDAETAALDRLRQALENDDKETILEEVAILKQNYTKLLTLFGSMDLVKQ